MPRFEIPANEVEDSWNNTELEQPVPADWYKARITDYTVRRSTNGNPNVLWEFTINNGEFDGNKVFGNTTLTSSAIWKLVALGNAVNYPITKGVPLKQQLDAILDREVGVEVVHREWEGVTRPSVNRFARLEENGSVSVPIPNGNTSAAAAEDSIPF